MARSVRPTGRVTNRAALASVALVLAGAAPAANAAITGLYEFNGNLNNSVTGAGTAPNGTGVNFEGDEFAVPGALTLERRGVAEYASIADDGTWVPNAGEAITVFARFRTAAVSNNFQILTSQWGTGGTNFHFNLRNTTGSGTAAEVEIYLNGTLAKSVTDAVVANQTYDAAFTVSTGGVLRTYVNGVPQGADVTGRTLANSAANVIIGSQTSQDAAVNFGGDVFEVRYYDEELSAAQVAALSVPEPAGLGALGVASLAALCRRRRRA